MIRQGYRFKFRKNVSIRQAGDTLLLATIAAQGLHGEARVRMDALFSIEDSARIIIVDSATRVGTDICGIFTTFLIHEFGRESFRAERLDVFEEARS